MHVSHGLWHTYFVFPFSTVVKEILNLSNNSKSAPSLSPERRVGGEFAPCLSFSEQHQGGWLERGGAHLQFQKPCTASYTNKKQTSGGPLAVPPSWPHLGTSITWAKTLTTPRTVGSKKGLVRSRKGLGGPFCLGLEAPSPPQLQQEARLWSPAIWASGAGFPAWKKVRWAPSCFQ